MSQMKTFSRPVVSNEQERKAGDRGGLLLMLALYSNPRWLSVVRGTVERLTETLGFPIAQCRSITRAVDEALTNIVRHSYGNRPDQPIAMYFRKAQRRHHGQVQQGLETFFVTAAQRLTRRSSKVDLSMKYAPADWDCTSSVKPWTRWNSRARVPRTGCASSSI